MPPPNTLSPLDLHPPPVPPKKPSPGLSTFEKHLDKLDDSMVAAQGLFTKATLAYTTVSANSAAIAAASKAIIDAETFDAVKRTARDLLGPAKKVMEGLDALSGIHPFVKVAVMAFNALITLELKRRENDKRICALLLKQADMMVALLQLAEIKDPDMQNPNGETIRGRMQGVLKKVKQTIDDCGNAIDSYYKQKFIVKFFKAHSFESKFMGFAGAFDDRKGEIQFALQINVAVTVQSVNAKIDTLLTAIFQHQTSKERQLSAAIDARGGKEKVLEDNVILEELVAMTEVPTSGTKATGMEKTTGVNADGPQATGRKKSPAVNASLLFALHAELDVILDENRALFEIKMEAQTQQLEDAIVASESRIVAAFHAGPYERLKDPDIKAVWKEMNWRSTVKARHFILALHDYYIDRLTNPYALTKQNLAGPGEPLSALESAPHTPALSQAGTEISMADVAGHADEIERDAWCLPYLTVLHVPSILEAVDDDASTFVKIKEANAFSSSRPHGWSLPQWLSYWAHGWAVETNLYRVKFARMLNKLVEANNHVLPENRNITTDYIDDGALYQARLIVSSTNYADTDDPDLLKLVRQRMEGVEARLEHRLKARKFVIDAAESIEFVCGTGRIEKYIFPLLYLLMKHHYGIIKLASQVILDERELQMASQTISVLTTEVGYRLRKLAESFRQQRLDPAVQFGSFANGIFEYSWKEPPLTKDVPMFVPDEDDSDGASSDSSSPSRPRSVAGGPPPVGEHEMPVPEVAVAPPVDEPTGPPPQFAILPPTPAAELDGPPPTDASPPPADGEEEFTVDYLRFAPLTLPVLEDIQNLAEEYQKSGDTFVFPSQMRNYLDLLKRKFAYERGDESQNPPLNEDEANLLKETEESADPAHVHFYQTVADFEYRKLPKHISTICDNCDCSPVQGYRWKCIDCADFDLCDNCVKLTGGDLKYDTKSHPETHNLIRLAAAFPRWEVINLINKANGVISTLVSAASSADAPAPDLESVAELSHLVRLKFNRAIGAEDTAPHANEGSEDGEGDQKSAPHEIFEARMKESNAALESRMDGFQTSLQDLEKRFSKFEAILQAIAAKLDVTIAPE